MRSRVICGLMAATAVASMGAVASAATEHVRQPTAAEDATLVPTVRATVGANWQSKIRVKTRISTVNSKWAGYSMSPRPGYERQIQGGYGFARRTASGWKIVDFGTSQVGCRDVPHAVIRDLQPSILGFVESC